LDSPDIKEEELGKIELKEPLKEIGKFYPADSDGSIPVRLHLGKDY